MKYSETTIATLCRIGYLDPSERLGLGIHPIDAFKFINLDESETQAFIAYHADTAFFVIRGTDSIGDIWDDMRAWPTVPHVHRRPQLRDWFTKSEERLHRGFLEHFSSIREQAREILQKLRPARVWFCGHSLGGAIANIALRESLDWLPAATDRRIFTLGAPRVGNDYWAIATRCSADHVYRFVYGADPVCRVPLSKFNWPLLRKVLPVYSHVGSAKYIEPGEQPKIHRNPSVSRRLLGTAYRLTQAGLRAAFCDHSVVGYETAIEKAVTFRLENQIEQPLLIDLSTIAG